MLFSHFFPVNPVPEQPVPRTEDCTKVHYIVVHISPKEKNAFSGIPTQVHCLPGLTLTSVATW